MITFHVARQSWVALLKKQHSGLENSLVDLDSRLFIRTISLILSSVAEEVYHRATVLMLLMMNNEMLLKLHGICTSGLNNCLTVSLYLHTCPASLMLRTVFSDTFSVDDVLHKTAICLLYF